MNGIQNTYLYVCGSQRLLNIRRIYMSAGLIGFIYHTYRQFCLDKYVMSICTQDVNVAEELVKSGLAQWAKNTSSTENGEPVTPKVGF